MAFAEQHWWPECVGVRYHARTHVSHVHCLLAQTAFTATVTWTIEHTYPNTASAVGQTVQISDNYLNDGHLPPDGQSATECNMQITQASILCHNGQVWHLAIAVSFCRTTTHIADHHGGRRRGWSSEAAGADLTLFARCLLFFFTKLISAIRCRFTNVLACSDVLPALPIFDVRCVHRLNS